MPDLAPVFSQLREVLRRTAPQLPATHDRPDQLYLDTLHLQANRKPLFFGAVQLKKSHVSVHLMPVYLWPELLSHSTDALKARMHGKSCFNFKHVEPAVFAELEALCQAGYARYQDHGFVEGAPHDHPHPCGQHT